MRNGFNCPKKLSVLQYLSRKEFEGLCSKWNIDKGVREFTTRQQIEVLVMAFILRLESLREIESTLGVPRSTLSDANASRDAGFFQELCELVLWKIHDRVKARKIRQSIRTILAMDSTECRVNGRLGKLPKWEQKSCSKKRDRDNGEGGRSASVKLHIIWDIGGQWIEEFRITPGRENDAKAAKTFKIKANCTYVFDRAYNDLKFWWKIVDSHSHFVSRLKKLSVHWEFKKLVKEHPDQVGVLWDGEWKPSYPVLRKNPEIPKDFTLRHIIYRDPETKKVFHFITSDFKAKAERIANIYKQRWAVELLFRWLKGHLNIRYLDTRNTNSVAIQLAIAVLVQLLLKLFQLTIEFTGSLWECLRWIRTQFNRHGLAASLDPNPTRQEELLCA